MKAKPELFSELIIIENEVELSILKNFGSQISQLIMNKGGVLASIHALL